MRHFTLCISTSRIGSPVLPAVEAGSPGVYIFLHRWLTVVLETPKQSGSDSTLSCLARSSCGTGSAQSIREALSNGATPKLNFLVSGRISVVMSIFSVFGLSYGRSGNEICAEEGQNPVFDPQQNHVCIWVLAHCCAAFAAANSRLTPLMAHHKLLLVAPTFVRVFIINC